MQWSSSCCFLCAVGPSGPTCGSGAATCEHCVAGPQAGGSDLLTPHPSPPERGPERALRIPQGLHKDYLKVTDHPVANNKTQAHTSTHSKGQKCYISPHKKSKGWWLHWLLNLTGTTVSLCLSLMLCHVQDIQDVFFRLPPCGVAAAMSPGVTYSGEMEPLIFAIFF